MKFFKDQFGRLFNKDLIRVILIDRKFRLLAFFDSEETEIAKYLTEEEAIAALDRLEKELNEDS